MIIERRTGPCCAFVRGSPIQWATLRRSGVVVVVVAGAVTEAVAAAVAVAVAMGTNTTPAPFQFTDLPLYRICCCVVLCYSPVLSYCVRYFACLLSSLYVMFGLDLSSDRIITALYFLVPILCCWLPFLYNLFFFCCDNDHIFMI